MRKLRWIGLIALGLLAAIFMVSGGSPRRMLVGLLSGPEALAYLPPRKEVSLAPGPPQPWGVLKVLCVL